MHPLTIPLPGKAMKFFLERLAEGRRSFRDLGMGETAALSLSKGMRRGQDSPVNKALKKPAREPWNERKDFMACSMFEYRLFDALSGNTQMRSVSSVSCDEKESDQYLSVSLYIRGSYHIVR